MAHMKIEALKCLKLSFHLENSQLFCARYGPFNPFAFSCDESEADAETEVFI